MARPTFLSILRRTLRIWIFLPGMVFVVALGLLLAMNAYSEVKKRNRVVSGAISYYVSSYIDDAFNALNHFSRKIGPHEQDMKKALEGFYGAYPHFERLLWLSGEGTILEAAPSGAEGLPFPVKLDIQQQGGIMSRPIVSPATGHPVIYIGVPHHAGNVLVGEMDTLSLSQHLGGLLPPGNTIILTDAFGNIVSHPDRSRVLRQENIGSMSLMRFEAPEHGATTRLFTHEGSLYIGSLARIAAEDWKIVIMSEASSVFIPIFQTVLALLALVTTLFLMVSGLMSNALKTGLVLPLEDFMDDIKKLAGGEDVTASPARSTYRELETVEEEFRKMAREVRGREEELSENAERYRALFEDNRLPQALMDPQDGSFLEVNKAAVNYYGFSPNAFKSMTSYDIDTQSPEVIRRLLEEAGRNDFMSPLRCEHRLASGELRKVDVYVSPRVHLGKELHFITVIDLSAQACEARPPRDGEDE